MSIYSAAVLADSPLGYWRMDDNAANTTLTDASGNGHNGVMASNTNTLTTAGALPNDTDAAMVGAGAAFGSVTINLGSLSHVTVECWLYIPSFNNSDDIALEYGTGALIVGNGWIVDPNDGSNSKFTIGMGLSTGSKTWLDSFTRPSAGAWHHYVFDMDRAGPTNLAYVDGQPVSLTTENHGAGTYGNYGSNGPISLLARTSSSLFMPSGTKLDELAVYSGGLSAARVLAHYQAARNTGFDTAGGTDSASTVKVFTRTTSDTVGGTDNAFRSFPRTSSDTAGGTDAASRLLHLAKTGADTAGGTDSATKGSSRTTTDTAGGTDSAGRAVASFRQGAGGGFTGFALLKEDGFHLLTETGGHLLFDGTNGIYFDTAGGTDAATRLFTRTASDTAGGIDSASRQVSFARTTADTAGATDSAARTVTHPRTTSDTAGGTDSASRSFVVARSTSDTAGATDSAGPGKVLNRTTGDSAGGTDATSRSVVQSRTAADTAGATDSASRITARSRTATDIAGASDSAVRILRTSRICADTAGATDSAVIQLGVFHCADTAGATDSATRAFTALRTGTDTAGGTDSATTAHVVARTSSDAAGGTDAAARHATYARTTLDIAGASDSVTRILHAARISSDTSGATDAAVIQFGVFRCFDTAGGTDSATSQRAGHQFSVYRLTSAGPRWTVTAPSRRWLLTGARRIPTLGERE